MSLVRVEAPTIAMTCCHPGSTCLDTNHAYVPCVPCAQSQGTTHYMSSQLPGGETSGPWICTQEKVYVSTESLADTTRARMTLGARASLSTSESFHARCGATTGMAISVTTK